MTKLSFYDAKHKFKDKDKYVHYELYRTYSTNKDMNNSTLTFL